MRYIIAVIALTLLFFPLTAAASNGCDLWNYELLESGLFSVGGTAFVGLPVEYLPNIQFVYAVDATGALRRNLVAKVFAIEQWAWNRYRVKVAVQSPIHGELVEVFVCVRRY